jgi:hypothetical protein
VVKELLPIFISSGKEGIAIGVLTEEVPPLSQSAKELVAQIFINKELLPTSILIKEQVGILVALGQDLIPEVYPDGMVTDTLFDGCYTNTISAVDYNGGKYRFTFAKEDIALVQTGKENVYPYIYSKENIPIFISLGKE